MPTNKARFRKSFLLGLVIVTSAAFAWMLQTFLVTILLSAIFSGLVYPVFWRLTMALKGRKHLASTLTLLGVLLLVVLPLAALLTVVINQAIRVTENIQPVVQRIVNEPSYLDQQIGRVPGFERIAPYRDQIVARAGDAVNLVGGFLIASVSEATRMTVTFVFHFFIMLYTMFFLLVDGPRMLDTIIGYLPLRPRDAGQMKERFVSITRATIKGTIVIGIVQGALSGLAFRIVGIPDVLFWTVMMIVLSILPLVGGALVWVPAALFLVVTGEFWRGVILAGFCALIVGSIDNVLRPRLVGQDTKMHDLLILFSTLGGIIVFGPLGFIVGPILAGIFLSAWELFGAAYHDELEDEPGDELPPALDDRAATPAAEIP
jgi:predicted PurR-regulated permease PerM